MIYCIGQKLVYERAFATRQVVEKEGRRGDGYPGGWVFRTQGEAQMFLARKGLTFTHGVYGVEADWETGTEQLPNEPYRRLIQPARVVRLP